MTHTLHYLKQIYFTTNVSPVMQAKDYPFQILQNTVQIPELYS